MRGLAASAWSLSPLPVPEPGRGALALAGGRWVAYPVRRRLMVWMARSLPPKATPPPPSTIAGGAHAGDHQPAAGGFEAAAGAGSCSSGCSSRGHRLKFDGHRELLCSGLIGPAEADAAPAGVGLQPTMPGISEDELNSAQFRANLQQFPRNGPDTEPMPSNPARVLVIEDDAVLRAAITDTLDAAGFTVQALADGVDFTNRAAAFQPDAAIIDVMLPGTSGLAPRPVNFEADGDAGRPVRPPLATAWATDSPDSRRAPTTTSSSRSCRPSWWPDCGAVLRRAGRLVSSTVQVGRPVGR